ncbi:MAG: HNH endonuclease, partial [Lachnospiraceae bacterium]|nr:HNH endonuclease [Lachnospiraceae bacterium]
QPFKYVCKYFNIKPSEETLSEFEKVVNDFSAVEQGKNLLKNEREEIISNISDKIPTLIRVLAPKKLRRKLGFRDIDFSQVYFPKFGFQYISAGGNSFQSYDVVFDIENLDRFIRYLAELVKFRKSVAGQRALMTSMLREKIKARDNYTCKHCGLSTMQEPNLLLEIDHIMPLSRNGLTTEENLQTLCWRCNRSKGAKIIN